MPVMQDWNRRYSKILLAIFPKYVKDHDLTSGDNARARQHQYQRAMAMLLLCLLACAKLGIKCTRR